MKSIKKTLLYGFLIWLIPFATAFLIFPIHESNRALFESIMPVVVTICVVFFANVYLRKSHENFLREGMLIGIIWLVMSFAIDLAMFMQGPMKMSFLDYVMDIGLTYLIMPIITIGFGYLLKKRQ
ncbi:MAG: hypothetical protein AABZ32_05175 [Bacteroidota bacterium]